MKPATPFYREVKSEDQIFDENPPTPVIHSIDADGVVKIRFNSTMIEEELLMDQELEDSRRRQLKVDSDDEVIPGKAKSNYSNFTRLHNSTISLDGIELPSLAVSIEPAEPDNTSICSK